MEYCPQCGENAGEYDQGVCVDCCDSNQAALDLHNAEFGEWERLSDEERSARIVAAML